MAVPGDTVGNYAGALHLLSEQATYLYGEGSRYWYDVAASVAKMAREQADRLRDRPEETWAEILRRLTRREGPVRGMFARVQVGPEKSDDIADEAAVRLVIVHPKFRHARADTTSSAAVWALAAAQGRGTAQRLNRNMIVFLAADARRYESLDEAVRQYLAWSDLGSEQRITELDLPPQQATQARKRLTEADRTVDLRISDSYQWLLVPVPGSGGVGLAVDEHRADTAKERLAERASDKLRAVDLLRVVQGPQNIRLDLDKYLTSVWSRDGHIPVGQLWKYYCEYPYLPRLAERSVLENGIVKVFDQVVWEQDGFAVASGFDSASGRYVGLALPAENTAPSISDTTLLVHPQRALEQRAAERAEAEAARRAAEEAAAGATAAAGGSGTEGGSGTGSGSTSGGGVATMPGFSTTLVPDPAGTGAPGTSPVTPPPPRPPAVKTRFYGRADLDPERYARDFNRLSAEVIQHLAALDGVNLEISIEITAVKHDGFPDDKMRIVSENARTLKFAESDFEDK
jgi:hypothetical protein